MGHAARFFGTSVDALGAIAGSAAMVFAPTGTLTGGTVGAMVATPPAMVFTTTGTLTNAASAQVAISAQYLYGIGELSNFPATAQYSLLATGQARGTTSDGTGGTDIVDYPSEWLLSGVNSDYEVWCTVDSGTVTGSATGSWLLLSTTRSWTKTKPSSPIGLLSATITVQIRRVSDSVVLDTATITLDAEI